MKVNMNLTKRICLWSGPRNISTALMYSFSQRNDTKVFDEPLYAHYLNSTTAYQYHPGAKEILENQEKDGVKVIKNMMAEHKYPLVFFKNMTHHLINLDKQFMKNTINIILTRNPIDMIPSFNEIIKNPSINDLGYKDHINLLKYMNNHQIEPIVIDSKNILLNPKKELKKLCSKINIEFDESMLSWKSGPKKEDGIWAKYWYNNVHLSTGFNKYKAKTKKFPIHLEPLLKECQKYYRELTDLI